MASRIITKKGSGAPLASDLVHGELAVDTVNKRLYTENAGGTIIELGTAPSTIDINAGTIDGTVIGGSSAAAGTFTSITGTSANINGTVTADGLTVDGNPVIQGNGIDASAPKIRINNTLNSGSWAAGTVTGRLEFYSEDTSGTGAHTNAKIETRNTVAGGTLPDGNLVFSTNEYNSGAITDRMVIGSTGDISFYEDTGTTAKFFWDASAESLGIGTTSPAGLLMLNNSSGAAQMYIKSSDTGDSSIIFGDQSDAATGSISYNHTDDSLRLLGYNNTERMRIDSSGNVGIGTTSPSATLSVDKNTAQQHRALDIENNSITYTMYVDQDNTGTNSWSLFDTTNSQTALRYLPSSSGYWQFYTNNTEAARIDSSGNVGIGTSSPDRKCSVSVSPASGGDDGYRLTDGTRNTVLALTGASYTYRSVPASSAMLYNNAPIAFLSDSPTGRISFHNDSGETMRIDSSGNLLVGKTSSNPTTNGVEVRPDGLWSTANSTFPLFLNRNTTDGELIRFRKDNVTVGGIGSVAGVSTYIHGGTGYSGLTFGNDELLPCNESGATRDAAIDLGGASGRFKDLYLSGGVYLGGTGAANLLDDYETGDWTPTSGTNSTVNTISACKYVKVGDFVQVYGYITSITTTSTAFTITGLPFTCNGYGPAMIHFSSGNNQYTGNNYVEQSTTTANLNTASTITAGPLMVSFSYKVL